MNASRRGALIVLEGCDRCGKSTQVKRLVDHLNANGKPAKVMRFPDRTTPIGKMIHDYLSCTVEMDNHALHLLFSANRWEAIATMKRQLASGVSLVLDRYAYSGVAFTAVKGIDIEWCKAPDAGLPRPDAVIYLDLSIEDAEKRGGFGGERYEQRETQIAVGNAFKELRTDDWRIVDASNSPDKIAKEIRDYVTTVVDQNANKPLGKLW